MVDGSYSQFKATKGRKADRDYKKDRMDKKKLLFKTVDSSADTDEKKFSPEEIELTKQRMQDRIAKSRRRQLVIVLITITVFALLALAILK